MVAAVNWEAALSGGASEIMTTVLNSLANDTISSLSSEVANDTGLDTHFWLELNVTFGTAPDDAVPRVDVYMVKAPDGTNYDSSAVTGGADQNHLFLGYFPIRKVTSAQRIIIGPFLLPPCKVKFQLDNQTGQSMAASGNTLDIYPASLESQ